jgi:hypothetical protein
VKTTSTRSTLRVAIALGLLAEIGASFGATAQESAAATHGAKVPYSPYANPGHPIRPYFGDTHLHTAASFDAGTFGARVGPRDAYRFAKGYEIKSSSGQPVKLSRPLDFLVVADHSDNMGFFSDFLAGKPELLADPQGRKWYDMMKAGKGADVAFELIMAFSAGTFPNSMTYLPGTAAYKSAWLDNVAAAEENNDPGRAGEFIGLRRRMGDRQRGSCTARRWTWRRWPELR